MRSAIFLARRYNGPGDAGLFVGDGDVDDFARFTLGQLVGPTAQLRGRQNWPFSDIAGDAIMRTSILVGQVVHRSPELTLRAGAAIIGAKLEPLGFDFEITRSGASSGGNFAEGRFRSNDRELWLSFRHSLGVVRYRKGNVELTHEQYIRALGLRAVAQYPGFSSDPMAAFTGLLSDLGYCDGFLLPNGMDFLEIAANYSDPPSGFRRLSYE